MKVSREKRSENRAAIVEAASRLFRERGPEGVGVAEITKAAGLTHGGFYGHFASKEALMAEAMRQALVASADQLASLDSENDFERYSEGYLSAGHLLDRAGGCAIAGVGSEMARQSLEVRTAFADGMRAFIAAAAATSPAAHERKRTIVGLATMGRRTGDGAGSSRCGRQPRQRNSDGGAIGPMCGPPRGMNSPAARERGMARRPPHPMPGAHAGLEAGRRRPRTDRFRATKVNAALTAMAISMVL